MALDEDFTTYTEEDPNTGITNTSTRVTWALNSVQLGYFYTDKGSNFFSGNFSHTFTTLQSLVQSGGLGYGCWLLSNTIDQMNLLHASNDVVSIRSYDGGGAPAGYRLEVIESGASKGVDTYVGAQGTVYYVTVERDANGGVGGVGRYTAYFRTGSHEGPLQDTIIVDATAQINYRYIYPFNLWNYGTSRNNTGWTENLNLNVVTVIGKAFNMTEIMVKNMITKVAQSMGMT